MSHRCKALAGLRFVAMLNVWQMRWRGLATGTGTLVFGNDGSFRIVVGI
jgi:hypothetical protein